jgi:hypothetical protein
VTYTLRDIFGAILSVGHGTIALRNQVSCFVDQLKNAAAPDFDLPPAIQFRLLEIAGDQPLSVLAIRGIVNQRKDFIFTTLPIADLTQPCNHNSTYIPELLDGAGYTTSLILLNTSNAWRGEHYRFWTITGFL